MRTLVLDCHEMNTREHLHAYLRKVLGLPPHYGDNLDALCDCLGEIGRRTEFVLAHPQQLDYPYGRAFLHAMHDICDGSAALSLRVAGEEPQ
ncbi:MAG: barstar family protein [Clostridia bacterium]|nr:barstar family protein [Clostridia bacterium]